MNWEQVPYLQHYLTGAVILGIVIGLFLGVGMTLISLKIRGDRP